MYIYEAKGLDIEGIKGNGVIVTPEKAEQDDFTPAAVGDTCILLIPYFDDEANVPCVMFMDNYTVAFSTSEDAATNEGYKVFVFQGEVTGSFGGDYGKLKGLIFKSVINQCEMTPVLREGEIIFGIADEIDTGDGWVHLDTPIKGQVTIASTPSITVDQTAVSVEEAKTVSVAYETIPHMSDSDIAVDIEDNTICGVTLDKGSAIIEGLKEGETTVAFTITVNDTDYTTEITVTVTK